MQRGRLHIIGIRHHSPAGARLVTHTIRRLRPGAVLIEGPSDMNARLDELLRPHRLPIAIFSFQRGDGSRGTYAPFCRTSPEWQALQAGAAVGATVRFMDLPGWHEAFSGVENRYSDGARREAALVRRLCARYRVDGYDALWDHLFEDRVESDEEFSALQARQDAYFLGLREGEAAGPHDAPRERLMREFIAHALTSTEASGRPVVVVCGGFHAPALIDLGDSPECEPQAGSWPEVTAPEGAASYLIPWSFHRLDAFSGYASGMPSPGYYDQAYAHGVDAAADRSLNAVITALREFGVAIPAADVIAIRTMAEGLARLRGHRAVLRSDLLDGIAAALVKAPLDAPVPWHTATRFEPDSEALLVRVMRVLSGHRWGKLAPGARQPPLIAEVAATLEAMDVVPTDGKLKTIALSIARAKDLQKSRVLHRLRVLGISGVRLKAGFDPLGAGLDSVPTESWEITYFGYQHAGLIEAAAWGTTLSDAASARIERALQDAHDDLAKLVGVLADAILIGLDSLTERAAGLLRKGAMQETDLAHLGSALHRMFSLSLVTPFFGVRGHPTLGKMIADVYRQGLWLLEHVVAGSGGDEPGIVDAVLVLRDVGRNPRMDASPDDLVAVCRRLLQTGDLPPSIFGACFGVLWSLGALTPADGQEADADEPEVAVRIARRMARPQLLGDFLAGLFVLAREEVQRELAVLAVIDDVVAGMSEAEFLAALPALRMAYSFFPPRERRAVAAALIGRGDTTDSAAALALSGVPVPADIVVAREVENMVDVMMARYGLRPNPGKNA